MRAAAIVPAAGGDSAPLGTVMVTEGKVRYIGSSTFQAWQLVQAQAVALGQIPPTCRRLDQLLTERGDLLGEPRHALDPERD